jgi:Type II secretion system (T2SS), protein G
MQCMISMVLAASLCGLADAQKDKEDDAKVKVAKAQLAVLDKAVAAYFVKNTRFPDSLKTLVDDGLLKADSIIDPWKKEYQYEVGGKHNGDKKPDIWTVTPDKKTIGNWPEKKE